MPLKDTIVNDTVELITRIIVVTCPQGQLAARVTRERLSPVHRLDRRPSDIHLKRLEKRGRLWALPNELLNRREKLMKTVLVRAEATGVFARGMAQGEGDATVKHHVELVGRMV